MVVQFTHPGREHKPAGAVMDWNRKPHLRKFLKGEAQYFDEGVLRRGPVTFWGEWEPQSTIIETYPRGLQEDPRWLHAPWWELPRHRRLLQNTDPLVFGDRFLYSNCRQRAIGKLRALPPGSLIFFGSGLGRSFVLDTVLVTEDAGEAFVRGDSNAVSVPAWVDAVLFGPLRWSADPPTETFRLYRGASALDHPSRPFSFVPCRPYVPGASRFSRPPIHLDSRWITPSLVRGARVRPGTHDEVRTAWAEVVDQVGDAGLALGVAFDPPPNGPPASAGEPDEPSR